MSRDLSDRARELQAVLTDEPTLAYDLAQAAEVDNAKAGQALQALERRGLAGREYDDRLRVSRWFRTTPPE